jgi:hypothetical protein
VAGIGQRTRWAAAASGLGAVDGVKPGAVAFSRLEEGGSGGDTPRGGNRWRTVGRRAAVHRRGTRVGVGGGDEVLGMRAGVGG